jgi:FkbM family methyltransferase
MNEVFETRYGAMECFEADTVVSRSLKLYGEWAQLELDLVHRLIAPGATVLDVGAFLGTHTLAFAQMVGRTGKVHSFEPRELVRAVLRSNVQRNHLSQVELHPCALGQHDAELHVPALANELGVDQAVNFGGLALTEAPADTATAQVETIRLLPLDSFKFDRVDFIKIDAEGMEAEVLLGGAETLARCRPVILAECNDLERGAKTLQACLAAGYAVFGTFEPAYNPQNFRASNQNIFGEAGEASLLAVPEAHLRDPVVLSVVQALPRIDSLDALALLMLHKPQYPSEVLASSQAAAVLGVQFRSPLSRALEDQVSNLKSAIEAMRDESQAQLQRTADALHAANERVQQLSAYCADLDARTQVLAQHLAAAEQYRSTSLRHWWRALSGKLG